jgi:putative ABC transport system substrate-binding protein
MLSTSLEMRMRRREFLGLVGGAAAAWPLAARAQRTERVRRIGVLMSQASSDPVGQACNAAFVQGLQEAGWTIGGNVHIDYRWAAEDVEQSGRDNATELVALAPDVILATGGIGVEPLLQVTRTVPIVFVQVTDPVGAGYVESLARPGGNATGFIPFEYSIDDDQTACTRAVSATPTSSDGASATVKTRRSKGSLLNADRGSHSTAD